MAQYRDKVLKSVTDRGTEAHWILMVVMAMSVNQETTVLALNEEVNTSIDHDEID